MISFSLILGLVMVVVLTYICGFSEFRNDGMAQRHPAMRVAVMVVFLPIAGAVLVFVGLIGLIVLTPYLSIIGVEWYFAFN